MLQNALQTGRGRVDVAHGVSKLVDGGRRWIRLLRGDPCSSPWLMHRLSLRLDRGSLALLEVDGLPFAANCECCVLYGEFSAMRVLNATLQAFCLKSAPLLWFCQKR